MNYLIVESHNDQYFIQMLLKEMEAEAAIKTIFEYEHSNLEKRNLTRKLGNILLNGNVKKLGVILDMDDSNETERIDFVNCCLAKAIEENLISDSTIPKLTKINDFITILRVNMEAVKVACYFVNVDGKGELEDILIKIANQEEASFANAFDAWAKSWIKNQETDEKVTISEKEFKKLWLENYKRFDTLKKRERNQDRTNWQIICLGNEKIEARGPKIFDLANDKHTSLNELKKFLSLVMMEK